MQYVLNSFATGCCMELYEMLRVILSYELFFKAYYFGVFDRTRCATRGENGQSAASDKAHEQKIQARQASV